MERNRFSKFRIRCCSYKRHKTGQPFMSTINNDVWHDLLENKARYVHAHVSTVASKTRIASNFLLGHSSRAEFGGGEILLEIKLIDQFHAKTSTNTSPLYISFRITNSRICINKMKVCINSKQQATE